MKPKSNKSKPTYLYASLSVAIVLFLLGLFFILLIHSGNLADLMKEQVNIVVELEDDQSSDELVQYLTAQSTVKPGSVEFVSKEDGLEFMTEGRSIDFLGDNPLRDMVTFNIAAAHYTEDNVETLKTTLKQRPEVSMVYYENMILDSIKENIRRVSTFILLLGLLFVFMAVIIIRNTINLSMYADRSEIQTLERVGAKWSFIKMPYIKSSVLVGVRGWVIAVLSLVLILVAVSMNFPTVWSSLNIFYILVSLALLLVVAIVIPALVSNSAANQYLQQK